MAKRVHVALYYAEDKDIFDILMSSKRRFDAEALVELARRRGIILSDKWEREMLADYLSRLVWGWPELQNLLELSEPTERKEKLSSTRFDSAASLEQLTEVVDATKIEREGKYNEAMTLSVASNKLVATIRYTEFDPSKTRLQQRVEREVNIEFEQGPTGYNVRYQANERAREIATDMLLHLEKKRGGQLDATRIALKGIPAPELRTKFFLELMSKMEGFELRNVTSVSVDRVLGDSDSEQEEPLEEGGEGDSATEEAAVMLGEVKKAVLEGKDLLASREFQELLGQGFFLSRSVWRALEKKANGVEVEFEADFEDAKDCVGFRYNVRGVYERRSKGEEGIKKTRTAVAAEKRAGLLRSIEESAYNAMNVVVAEATGSSSMREISNSADKK